MPHRRLSELECFVLGLIWKYGPLTAYAIRQRLQQSPSTQWSGSAGSVYPLVRRLKARRLLDARPAGRGKRASVEYTATEAGITALRGWIGPPVPQEAISVSHDPLRARLRFLAVLPPQEQKAWLGAAIEAMALVADRVDRWEAEHADSGDPFDQTVTRSGRLDIQARQAWLREARDRLS